jgi:hypothetical protein
MLAKNINENEWKIISIAQLFALMQGIYADVM